MFPATLVRKTPVGIRVIAPPLVDMGAGAVMVLIVVTPDTKAIGVTGAIVAADASVGAPAVVPAATTPFEPTTPTTVADPLIKLEPEAVNNIPGLLLDDCIPDE